MYAFIVANGRPAEEPEICTSTKAFASVYIKASFQQKQQGERGYTSSPIEPPWL